eukprot:351723-Chlamydomonas_euryale.AAC.1
MSTLRDENQAGAGLACGRHPSALNPYPTPPRMRPFFRADEPPPPSGPHPRQNRPTPQARHSG